MSPLLVNTDDLADDSSTQTEVFLTATAEYVFGVKTDGVVKSWRNHREI
jgi:hypothetical protein